MERTKEEKMEIARTILRQLGGHKFVVMTGARQMDALDCGLRFKLPSRKTNLVTITLDPSDTYTMIFEKYHGLKRRTIAEYTGIYDDMLQEIFTHETGLDTHL
jgi:hypothetical protein